MTFYSHDIKILSLGMLVVVLYEEVMGHASVYPSASVKDGENCFVSSCETIRASG
jgi:hypothetical protein